MRDSVTNWQIVVWKQKLWPPFFEWVATATRTEKGKIYRVNREGRTPEEARQNLLLALERHERVEQMNISDEIMSLVRRIDQRRALLLSQIGCDHKVELRTLAVVVDCLMEASEFADQLPDADD